VTIDPSIVDEFLDGGTINMSGVIGSPPGRSTRTAVLIEWRP
jgi:hypothetical protein